MAERHADGRKSGRRAAGRRGLLLAIGPCVLVLILATLEPAQLVSILRRADPLPLLLAYLVPLPAIGLRVLRWRLLLGAGAAPWRTGELLVIYCQSIAAGVVTPGRLGEFAKAALVARRGTSPALAVQSALVDRLADVSCLAVLALGALPLVTAAGDEILVGALALAAVVVVSAGLWLLTSSPRGKTPRRSLRAALQRMLPGSPAEVDWEAHVLRVGPSAAGRAVSLTLLSWAITYGANHLYCLSLGLPISYLEIAAISALCSLIAALPISIAGAGTRDAALIAILAQLGIAPVEAVALSALMLSNVLFVGAVCALSFLALPRVLAGAPRSDGESDG